MKKAIGNHSSGAGALSPEELRQIESFFNNTRPTTQDSNLSIRSVNLISSEFIKFWADDKVKMLQRRPANLYTVSPATSNDDDVCKLERVQKNKVPDLIKGWVHDDFDARKTNKGIASHGSIPSQIGGLTNSWEMWWLQSQYWKRELVLLLLVLFMLALLNLGVSIYFIFAEDKHFADPHLCATDNCKDLAKKLQTSRDENVSPCEDFYQFTCGNHRDIDATFVDSEWQLNFGPLESEVESLLGEMLKWSDNPLAKQTIGFYKACLDTPRRKKYGMSSFAQILEDTFKGFDLWNVAAEPSLEMIAVRVLQLAGDFGFFTLLDTINYPIVYRGHDEFNGWVKHTTKENLKEILPVIYDALDIPQNKRHKIEENLLLMTGTWNASVYHGLPECDETSQNFIHYFDFNFPLWYVHLGPDCMEPVPGTNNRQWKLKDGKEMVIEMHPDVKDFERFDKNYKHMTTCWNPLMQRIAADEIRATYATFWSLTILHDLFNEIDDQTVEHYKLQNNPMFNVYKRHFKRSSTYQCLDSLTANMGYVPTFRLFLGKDVKKKAAQIANTIKEAAEGLLKKFAPPEEGGLSFISSFFRERAMTILLDYKNTLSILIPLEEDDETFPPHIVKELKNTHDHLLNAAAWRKYTLNRTFHFWRSGSPRGKLVWETEFYELENAKAFEAPGFSPYHLLKFPISFFIRPYYENDIMLADHAGAYNFVAKAWLKLIFFDSREGNVNSDIKYHKKNKIIYKEGILSDGDFTPCKTYAFAWNKDVHKHSIETVDPHLLAFRHGQKAVPTFEFNNPLPNILAFRTAYDMYIEKIEKLDKAPFWTLNEQERNFVMFERLIHHEMYTKEQIFFMNYMRHHCRVRENANLDFKHHVTDSLSSLMHSNEFSKVWHCPPGSPMNPKNKCYSSL